MDGSKEEKGWGPASSSFPSRAHVELCVGVLGCVWLKFDILTRRERREEEEPTATGEQKQKNKTGRRRIHDQNKGNFGPTRALRTLDFSFFPSLARFLPFFACWSLSVFFSCTHRPAMRHHHKRLLPLHTPTQTTRFILHLLPPLWLLLLLVLLLLLWLLLLLRLLLLLLLLLLWLLARRGDGRGRDDWDVTHAEVVDCIALRYGVVMVVGGGWLVGWSGGDVEGGMGAALHIYYMHIPSLTRDDDENTRVMCTWKRHPN
jgi:hypothetical protein